MPIIACGINHKTAPVALRERVVFMPEKLGLYLQALMEEGDVKEAVLLSTCNRSELYCETEKSSSELQSWFASQHGVPAETLKGAMYFYEGEAAVRHIMQVACGLDSMVLGESQILGQMKTAFSESCAAGAAGPLFNRLFQQVFIVAKAIRTHTDLGACPVSVSSAAVRFVAEQYDDLTQANVAVVGAGLTVELILRHLMPLAPKQVTLVNRNLENAHQLAKQYQVRICELSRLPQILLTADVVITATGSPKPLILPNMLASLHRPLFIVDIAVPRDVDAAVAKCTNVQLFSIDHLRDVLAQGLNTRQHAAEKAYEMIQARCSEFMAWLASIDLVTTTICAWRYKMEKLCETELERSMRYLRRGTSPETVLRGFAHALTQKILHAPSVQLRQAGIEKRTEMLQLARELFAISELGPT